MNEFGRSAASPTLTSPTLANEPATPSFGELMYSAGPDEACWHVESSRIRFHAGQKTYGGRWSLIADELAEDYHSSHDGWEASWPLQLRIYSDGAEVARFEIEREYEPTFMAHELALPGTTEDGSQTPPASDGEGFSEGEMPTEPNASTPATTPSEEG